MYNVYNDEGEHIERLPVWEVKEYKVEENDVFIWPRETRDDGKSFGFDKNTLARIEAEYLDRVQFYAQYYNDPNDADSNRIDPSRFQYFDPKRVVNEGGRWYYNKKPMNVYAAIDFAFTKNKKSDYTAIVVIGIDNEGYIYVLDIDRFKTDKISEYFEHILRLHSQWMFKRLRAEVTVAQSIICNDLKDYVRREGLSLTLDEHRPTRNEGSKTERIKAVLEPRYENLTIWHSRGGHTPALEEEVLLARPRHDDMKDALASVIEIATPPRRAKNLEKTNVIQFNSRFGGINFREQR